MSIAPHDNSVAARAAIFHAIAARRDLVAALAPPARSHTEHLLRITDAVADAARAASADGYIPQSVALNLAADVLALLEDLVAQEAAR